MHVALGTQIANPDGRGKGTNNRMHGTLPLSFRTHKTLPLSLRTYRMSTPTFIMHLTYVLSFRIGMIARVSYPMPQIHGTAYMHFHGILYSPLTTDCYVQFPLFLHPPLSALHSPPLQIPLNLTKSICRSVKLPPSVLVMPRNTAVLLSELTSDLVYPAALVPHAFSPGRDVSFD